MAFTLPSDLPTDFVDNSSTLTAAYFNNVATMSNAIKAAIGTWGYGAKSAVVTTSETTNSASYTDLTTTTDQVTVAIGSSGMALVNIRADITPVVNWAQMSYALSGDNTRAADDSHSIQMGCQYGSNRQGNLAASFLETGLTPGITTFKLKYKSNSTSNTQPFANRRISVIPFPSTDGTHAAGSFSLDDTISFVMAGAGINRPTYDALGAGYYNASNNTGGSFSHTGAAGATPILAVGVGVSTGDGVFSATYNGVAMVELGRAWASGNAGSTGVILYGLVGACTGSACTVAFTSSKNIDYAITMNCASYTGVAAFGKPVYAYGGATSPTLSTTALTPGSLAINGIQVQRSTVIPGYNQTSRYADARGSYMGFQFGECAAQSVAGATITFSATSGNNWGEMVVPLLPTAHTIMADKTTSTVVGSGSANISSTTFQHTGTSGTTPVVAVSFESGNSPFLSSTVACTYNGSAMTLIGYVPAYGTYDICTALFAKVGACTGSQVDVVVTNSPNAAGVMACCTSYTNVTSLKPPTLQPYTGSQPSVAVTSAAGDRVVAASHNHASGAHGYSMITGITRFNDNTNKVSSANPGTTFMADTPADTGTSTTVTASTPISYGQGTIGAALSTASPVSIAFDAVGGGGSKVGAGVNSWTHVVGANANFLLICLSFWNTGGFTEAITVGGTDITANQSYYTWYSSGGNYIHNRIYWMWNPPTGSQTVAITYSGGGPDRSSANSVSYTNVGKMLDRVDVAGSGTTAAATAWKMTTGGLYVGYMSANWTSAAPGSSFTAFNKTQRSNIAGISGASQPLVIGDTAGSTSDVTFQATLGSAAWGATIIPLVPTTYT